MNAIQALYQLSYTPVGGTCSADSLIILARETVFVNCLTAQYTISFFAAAMVFNIGIDKAVGLRYYYIVGEYIIRGLFMEYGLNEKYDLIAAEVVKSKSRNPIEIIKSVMHKDYVNIHGPEHHFLDGAAFLTAYKNAGGKLDLDKALCALKERTIKMPGAMCGQWGVCGSVTSIGAALSVIHGTGPLSGDGFYKDHMKFTSACLDKMSEIGGPRCCKRNAFLSVGMAIKFVEEHYGIKMESDAVTCEFTDWNKQCIKERCPFFNR